MTSSERDTTGELRRLWHEQRRAWQQRGAWQQPWQRAGTSQSDREILGRLPMTTMHCRYEGGLRCVAVHESSDSVLHTDAPVDNQGRGEAFSPTDLVATALTTCILTIMGIVAEREGLELDPCSATVHKTMTTTGVRRIELLEVTISLPPGLSDEQRRLLQRAGETCPVKRSLEGSVPMELHWH